MLFTTNKFISCLLSLLLLQISISVKPKKILTDEEKLKKGFFLDSYAISQSQIYLHTNFSKEIEKEKNIKRKLTETEITLTDVGFHNYDTNHPYAAYTNIFSNIGKDKSKYILYPYGFKYKNKEFSYKKNVSKGSKTTQNNNERQTEVENTDADEMNFKEFLFDTNIFKAS